MSIKRYVTSKDMMTTALDKTVEKEFVADAVALKDLNYRIMNLENTRVTGVKGDNEAVYRTGNVNLKPSHIGAISTSILGVAGGVAELDDSGKLKSSQLPSSVDDIVEGYYNTTDHKFYKESTYTTEIEGEADKIYLSLDTNLPYRWSGSAFVEIPWGLALGETPSTAYRGDRGKAAYDTSNANKTAISKLDADFATVETDAESSAHAYNIGDYFVIDHTLCRATNAIAIGDAIAVGTNAVAIVIMEELATNFVKGVKGNSENSYRHGNVNMTLANLGYESVNNLNTTESGKLLDARQGRVLNGSILAVGGRVDDVLSDIAPVEGDETSENAYTTGDYLIHGDILCKATNDIAIGDTLAIGTNLEAVKVMSETVVGVKGNAETTYRKGRVNLSLANLGYNVANNLTTDTAGYLLDARQGKVLNSSILSVSGMVEDLQSDIATVEESTTSTHSYAKDEYLILNGKFYKTTQAISVGDTLAVGTNITQTKVSDNFGSGGGSGGGGHTIVNSSGTAMTQRGKLRFNGFTVTDDSSNNTTLVTALTDINGHNIVNSSGTAMTQRKKLKFIGFTVADDSSNDTTKITAATDINGHNILNSSGTQMTQRNKLQFSGMNVSDSSSKTVVQGQLVKVTSEQYEALSSSAKNDANITYMITDAERVESIASTITISSSNWSNSTTTIDGVAYYTNEVSLATVFDSHPDVYLGALSTFPSNAEKQAYMSVDYITVDAATNKLKCYARSKPTANFVLTVKGVSV